MLLTNELLSNYVTILRRKGLTITPYILKNCLHSQVAASIAYPAITKHMWNKLLIHMSCTHNLTKTALQFIFNCIDKRELQEKN